MHLTKPIYYISHKTLCGISRIIIWLNLFVWYDFLQRIAIILLITNNSGAVLNQRTTCVSVPICINLQFVICCYTHAVWYIKTDTGPYTNNNFCCDWMSTASDFCCTFSLKLYFNLQLPIHLLCLLVIYIIKQNISYFIL